MQCKYSMPQSSIPNRIRKRAIQVRNGECGVWSAPQFGFRHRQGSCAVPAFGRSAAVPAAASEPSSQHPKNPTLSGLAKLLRVRTPALPPNRPSQNEFRKRAIQMRNGECGARPSLISGIAKQHAPGRQDPLPLRHSDCSCSVKTLARPDSARGRTLHVSGAAGDAYSNDVALRRSLIHFLIAKLQRFQPYGPFPIQTIFSHHLETRLPYLSGQSTRFSGHIHASFRRNTVLQPPANGQKLTKLQQMSQ